MCQLKHHDPGERAVAIKQEGLGSPKKHIQTMLNNALITVYSRSHPCYKLHIPSLAYIGKSLSYHKLCSILYAPRPQGLLLK